MYSDLQDWQREITEYYGKQKGQPYHTGEAVFCGFIISHRNNWQNFVCDNKDKIVRRHHTEIVLNNNERWVWVNPSNEWAYRGCRYHKVLADKYIDEEFIKEIILPCCAICCNSFEWF